VSAEGGAHMLLVSEEGGATNPTWSPDGNAVAYSVSFGKNAHIRILDLRTQQTTTVAGSNGYWSPRWSPDGKYLIVLKDYPPRLAFFNFAMQQWKELGSEVFNWPSWSRDSKSVYALSNLGSLVRIGIPDGKVERTPVPLQGLQLTGLYFSAWFGLTPDGRLITTRDTGIEEIYAFDLNYE
jgi:Tol biopolymer transport system component